MELMDVERRMREAALAQHGLVTREDLRRVGVTRGTRRGLVSSGALEVVGRQTFRIGGAPETVRQRVLAACLDTGGVATAGTAAWLHGLDGFQSGSPPEVVVARPQSDYRSPIARVHTTTWLHADDLVSIDGIPSLGMARTLFSLAAAVPGELGFDRVRGAVDEAVASDKATDPWLWWRLERLRRRGRNGVSVFEKILTARAGGEVTESWLERETLRVLRSGGLPLPECQVRVNLRGAFVARVDFMYVDQKLIVEVSGYRWHRTAAQMADDLRRRRELTLTGHQVLEYSYDDVVGSPEVLVAQVAQALGLRAAA